MDFVDTSVFFEKLFGCTWKSMFEKYLADKNHQVQKNFYIVIFFSRYFILLLLLNLMEIIFIF